MPFHLWHDENATRSLHSTSIQCKQKVLIKTRHIQITCVRHGRKLTFYFPKGKECQKLTERNQITERKWLHLKVHQFYLNILNMQWKSISFKDFLKRPKIASFYIISVLNISWSLSINMFTWLLVNISGYVN